MFWIISGVILGPIRPPKTAYWQESSVENGRFTFATMPIAIATDQWPCRTRLSLGNNY